MDLLFATGDQLKGIEPLYRKVHVFSSLSSLLSIQELHIHLPSDIGDGSVSVSMDLLFATGDQLKGIEPLYRKVHVFSSLSSLLSIQELHIHLPSDIGDGSVSVSMDLLFATGDQLKGIEPLLRLSRFPKLRDLTIGILGLHRVNINAPTVISCTSFQYKEVTGEACGSYPSQPINCWRHSLKALRIKCQKGLEDAAILRKFFANAVVKRRKRSFVFNYNGTTAETIKSMGRESEEDVQLWEEAFQLSSLKCKTAKHVCLMVFLLALTLFEKNFLAELPDPPKRAQIFDYWLLTTSFTVIYVLDAWSWHDV
ncbi:hypothetical protein Cgig2_014074 [Carnegiea gigantea]|uniref:Uncharacterized protein n=1 Tax=Carnegiea gigantea TaxID=171969 RepID=A0A9Q1QQZ4_9CARY|nr:hypothetical protein Cgig2_014074 [Carnegiea gigantea]